MTRFLVSGALFAVGVLRMTAADPPRNGFLWSRHFDAPEPVQARVHTGAGALMIACGLLMLLPR